MLNSILPSPRRRAIALAVAAVGAGLLATGGSVAPARKAPKEIRLVSVNAGPGGGADVPPQGDSIGDSDTFKTVVSSPKTGRHLGHVESVCTIFDVAKPGGSGPPPPNTTFHCLSNVRLPGGQLTLSARVFFNAQGKQSTDPYAILGGTGRYAGARGSAKFKPMGQGKTLIVMRFVR